MLRRRRSKSFLDCENKLNEPQTRLLRNDKLKMSPLPEEGTEYEVLTPSHSLKSTLLEDVSNKSTEKSRKRCKRRSLLNEAELPSAKKDRPTTGSNTSSTIRSMWEHAVTFMRGALDAILFDRSKAETVVTSSTEGAYQQASPDLLITESPASANEADIVTSPPHIKMSCHVTITPPTTNLFNYQQTPPTPGTYSISRTPQEINRYTTIKHPALKRYYQDSPESMVQNAKSFSSLLQERAKAANTGLNSIPELEALISTPTHQQQLRCQSSLIPAPPPLPPIAPAPPPLPPAATTPIPSEVDGLAKPPGKYSAALHSMQNRLQKRIKAKPVAEGNVKQQTDVNVKLQQWVEIQSHSKKMKVDDFLKLANQKRAQFVDIIKEVAQTGPLTRSQVDHMTEVVCAAPDWYPGSTKEIRESVAGYKEVEKKLETMVEYVQVSGAMREAIQVPVSLDMEYTKLREDFLHKHKVWCPILSTNACNWRKHKLPVDDQLLQMSKCHFLRLTDRAVSWVHRDSVKIDGILLSLKCFRTTTTKQHLLECFDMLIKSLDVWGHDEKQSRNVEDVNCLKENVLLTAHAFIHISLGQYEGYVCLQSKQEVMSHFEEVLKVVGLMKSFVMKCDPHVSRHTGYIMALPASEELGTMLHASCSKLIEHIITQSSAVIENGKADSSSRNIVLWMMFGCKYVNRVLDFLGSERADEQNMGHLLASLEQMENALQ